ncbi:MAG: hypothetical protein CM15mL4_2870 [uncultured marine virus]|nr:MAG: hypothetical protein CM15mL4_2870 [uncultured marine virus]
MVCTNDSELWDYAKLFRSHGMTREASSELQSEYKENYPDLNPLFTFAVPVQKSRVQCRVGIVSVRSYGRTVGTQC